MLRLESVPENFRRLIIWDFEMQTDHLIPNWRPDQVMINKKTKKLPYIRFWTTEWKWKKAKKWQVHRPCKRTKDDVACSIDSVLDVSGALRMVPKDLEIIGRINLINTKTDKNTQMSQRHLKMFAVTPLRFHWYSPS